MAIQPTSARFGQVGFGSRTAGGKLISVRLDANAFVHLTDRITRQFLGGAFQHALAAANEEMAIKVQEGMADFLDQKMAEHAKGGTARAQRPGHRLVNSILHPNNREVTASAFLVHREGWLDQSPAKMYWRSIERGMGTFDGYILFTDGPPEGPATGKRYGPWSPSGSRTKGGYSAGMPPGYKHMRMPQHRGAFVQNIGPYPKYEFTRGGRSVFRAMDKSAHYLKHLKLLGMEAQLRG